MRSTLPIMTRSKTLAAFFAADSKSSTPTISNEEVGRARRKDFPKPPSAHPISKIRDASGGTKGISSLRRHEKYPFGLSSKQTAVTSLVVDVLEAAAITSRSSSTTAIDLGACFRGP